MIYKALKLTKEDMTDPMKLGFQYANSHKGRWEDIGTFPDDEISTYDRGTSYFVFDDVVFTIYKDYIFIDDNVRLFIIINRELDNDVLDKPEGAVTVDMVSEYDPDTGKLIINLNG